MTHPTLELEADAERLQAVLLRLSWASQRRLMHEVESFGLTLPQFIILRALHRLGTPGGRMSELAEAANQVLPTVTGIVERLSERGLVERRRDSADRRSIRVTLTPEGERLLAAVDAHNRERMMRSLSALTPAERETFLEMMQRYLDSTLKDQL